MSSVMKTVNDELLRIYVLLYEKWSNVCVVIVIVIDTVNKNVDIKCIAHDAFLE